MRRSRLTALFVRLLRALAVGVSANRSADLIRRRGLWRWRL